jgi:hypothetical protein
MVQTKGNPLIGKLSEDITEGVSVAVGKAKMPKIKGFFLDIYVDICVDIFSKKWSIYPK